MGRSVEHLNWEIKDDARWNAREMQRELIKQNDNLSSFSWWSFEMKKEKKRRKKERRSRKCTWWFLAFAFSRAGRARIFRVKGSVARSRLLPTILFLLLSTESINTSSSSSTVLRMEKKKRKDEEREMTKVSRKYFWLCFAVSMEGSPYS